MGNTNKVATDVKPLAFSSAVNLHLSSTKLSDTVFKMCKQPGPKKSAKQYGQQQDGLYALQSHQIFEK
jgi:hypothetical protein